MRQSESHRLATLDEYYPKADPKDWRLQIAGQRVQIIKPDVKRGGLLESGTELAGVDAANSSLVALLGASPGALLIGMASTSDSIDEIRCVGRLLHAEPDIGPS